MADQFIRASQISTYTKSPFLLWADLFADKNRQDPPNAFQEMLFARGDEHEHTILNDLYADAELVEFDDAQEGFREVLRLMREGVQSITQAPLFWMEKRLRGRPDIIEKREGPSEFGDHYYIVKEIKYAKNLKQYHVLQAAFYNKLLGHIQGYRPEEFILINNEAEEFTYRYEDYAELLEDSIQQVRSIMQADYMPRPVYGEDWPWTSLSEELAEQASDLTLIYRLGSSVRARLNNAGIHTLQDFLDADKKAILAIKGIGTGSYNKWTRQAKALLQEEPIVLKKPQLPDASRHLYFDIEGDTELGVDYLYGVLEDDEFIAFWADRPEDEESMWNSFCEYIDELPDDAALYHYTVYEKQSIKRLYKRYGCEESLYEKMHSLLVDLFPILIKSVVLPLTSYSIKPVAKYLGFSWRASDAGGANSMEWYSRYLDGDENIKEKILAYNHDDVIATQVVKQWLETLKT